MKEIYLGNLDTAGLNRKLMNAQNIEGFFHQNKDELLSQRLTEYLETLLARKGLKRADVVRGSGLDRTYVYQIFSGEKTPSRDKLIAIAFGLNLTLDETQKMLKVSVNRELYPRDMRDAMIMFSLAKGQSIAKIDIILSENGFDPLVTGPKD